MDIIVSLLGSLVILVIVAGVVFLIGLGVVLFRSFTIDAAPKSEADTSPGQLNQGDQMNQGDFHSGPGGYSPGTSYPETFYGSRGFSDEAEFDGHDEGDFNR